VSCDSLMSCVLSYMQNPSVNCLILFMIHWYISSISFIHFPCVTTFELSQIFLNSIAMNLSTVFLNSVAVNLFTVFLNRFTVFLNRFTCESIHNIIPNVNGGLHFITSKNTYLNSSLSKLVNAFRNLEKQREESFRVCLDWGFRRGREGRNLWNIF